ncbi:MAG: hypothetical protein WC330_01005 [Candidatus Omnitrophota bacterium]|jgi:hypothetical protein
MTKKELFIVVLLGFVLCFPALLVAQERKKSEEPSQKIQKGHRVFMYRQEVESPPSFFKRISF